MRIEHLDDLGEVGKRTGQSIDLVDHHRIDLVGLNLGEKLLQGRAVQGAAGQAAVVVGNGQRGPAHPPLGLDVGLAGFALIQCFRQPCLGTTESLLAPG